MHVLPTFLPTTKPTLATLFAVAFCFTCSLTSECVEAEQTNPVHSVAKTNAFNNATATNEQYSRNYYAHTTIEGLSVPDNAVSFLTLGDWGRNGHFYQKHVAKWLDIASYQLDAEFIATTGDNFYDEPFYNYFDTRSQNAQYEEYGRTFELGFTWQLN